MKEHVFTTFPNHFYVDLAAAAAAGSASPTFACGVPSWRDAQRKGVLRLVKQLSV